MFIYNQNKQSSMKSKALLRIRSFLTQKSADILFNTFILPSFNYCPLVWMFCSKQAHNLLCNAHRRALCAKTGLFQNTYAEILKETNMKSIHAKNFENLMTEVYKSLHRLNPEIMWDVFSEKATRYKLRSGNTIDIPRAKSSAGINSIGFRASLAWNHLPAYVKSSTDLRIFKSAIGFIPISVALAQVLVNDTAGPLYICFVFIWILIMILIVGFN